ncbi:MAG: 30S ribosomal protein S17 [Elusimicrobia bacterium]|nr:30S ribosomal protein S17 [Elusimicrobiota bacterium]
MNEIKPSRTGRKVFRGVVVSDKMNKTRVVNVERTTRHPGYAKTMKKNGKFYAHDEANESRAGDTVELMSTRPLSSLKRWRVSRIIEKAKN